VCIRTRFRHFEGLTKGKINNGDDINANNVDFLKEYMDEVAFMQVKEMGREIDTHATTTDPGLLSPPDLSQRLS
jgi:hypothetical protein